MNVNDACIVGYYGMKNSGDDALLAASLWGAKNYLNAKSISVTTPTKIMVKNQVFAPSQVASQKFPGQNRLLRYGLAINAKNIVFGGGSVFHTAQDISIKLHMMKFSHGRKHRAVGVGLGPFKDTKAEKLCARFLKDCSFVGVRDQQSYEVAQDLAPKSNVKLTFDLAPSLLKQDDNRLQNVARSGVAFCLCPKERLAGNLKAETKRLEALADAIANIYRDTGEHIYLINFNGHSTLGDESVHRELERLVGNRAKMTVVPYDSNPYRVLQRMACFKAIVSMRLHGSILGYMAGTPVLSINYHSKCQGWCDQIGLPKQLQFNADAIGTNHLANEIINGLEHGFPENQLSVHDAVNASMKNWN